MLYEIAHIIRDKFGFLWDAIEWGNAEAFALMHHKSMRRMPELLCPICNRGIKLQREFKYGKHIHPYESPTEPSFIFEYIPKSDGKWDITIHGGADEELETAAVLETRDVYRCHADMEVTDILNFIKKNPPECLESLYSKVLGAYVGTITPEEVYRVLLGSEKNAENYLDRPLSKLKKDIIKQAIESYGLSIDIDNN